MLSRTILTVAIVGSLSTGASAGNGDKLYSMPGQIVPLCSTPTELDRWHALKKNGKSVYDLAAMGVDCLATEGDKVSAIEVSSFPGYIRVAFQRDGKTYDVWVSGDDWTRFDY